MRNAPTAHCPLPCVLNATGNPPRSRDGSGRASLPLDPPEGHGVEAWRASLALPCVVPPGLGEPASGAAAARKASQGAGLTSQDVVRALLSALSVGAPPMHHQLYLLAVGHCSKEHYTLLAQVRVWGACC